ncbi:transcription antitermination factor NusB [Ornithobacterium rhinotracheale]|uniref:transcription antitermination factor NusB n=1 Tax=Ornithobacterium rhinotracheale TaxID=28251 RepID=UPI00129CB4B8|nr:transcription antitermination factor NusB [Ornithobacterium rhinotracheale]MRJ11421.1 transcription antitermination factor NusB [Ornithobacterium rhinotracheale]
MLGRRQLRAKAMQALYAYYRGNDDVKSVEINMVKGVREIETLYMVLLELTLAIKSQAEQKIEIGLSKNFPTPEEANPNRRFVENPIFKVLEVNPQLKEFREEHKEFNWDVEDVYPKKIFRSFIESEEYKNYMTLDEVNFKEHSKIVCVLFEKFIAPSAEIASFLEDKKLNWANDLAVANTMTLNTLRSFTAKSDENTHLLKLLLDESHLDFTRELVRQSLRYQGELTQIIKETASNWELDRMALLDRIMLQMALAEFLHFPSIPTKVTINEYVEIAKNYSTLNSATFINGILDKASKDLNGAGRIRKSARGLM